MSEVAAVQLTNTVLATMSFPQRLIALRKERGLTQQALADLAALNVVQIRRYETSVSQPSIEAVKKIARAFYTTTDLLLFDEGERGPSDDFRLEFEALDRLDPDEKQVVKALIESIVVKHDVKRLGFASSG